MDILIAYMYYVCSKIAMIGITREIKIRICVLLFMVCYSQLNSFSNYSIL